MERREVRFHLANRWTQIHVFSFPLAISGDSSFFSVNKTRWIFRLTFRLPPLTPVTLYDPPHETRSREKLRPKAEIAKARVKIFNCKLKVRELFKELDYETPHGNYVKIPKAPANDAADVDDDAESDSGIDCSDIFCAKCGKGDADDDDDILLCDGFCECAFHMSCLDPVVTAKDLQTQTEDDDWMCHTCDARADAFYSLNAVLDYHIDAAKATHLDVFQEEHDLDLKKQGPGQANDAEAFEKQKSNAPPGADELWPDDESCDSDFGAHTDSDGGTDDDDEPLSGSARGDDENEDGDEESESSPEVLLGKRKRQKVDYKKLNDEMFGGKEAFAGEAEDEKTGGWGPASPAKPQKRGKTMSSPGPGKNGTTPAKTPKKTAPGMKKSAKKTSSPKKTPTKKTPTKKTPPKKTPTKKTKTPKSPKSPKKRTSLRKVRV